MKSYASVDRIEGKFAVCEVELLETLYSKTEYLLYKETEMMDIPMCDILNQIGPIEEGDILVVEHNGMEVTNVYGKDYDEKARRIEMLEKIMNS